MNGPLLHYRNPTLYANDNAKLHRWHLWGTVVEQPASWPGVAKRLVLRVDGCWGWTGALNKPNGYAVVALSGGGKAYLHRLMYQTLRGAIPDGLQLDHLCRNRWCSNPSHLEPVTALVNSQRGHGNHRKTHCPQGHPYDADNTYVAPGKPRRHCRTCRREAVARFHRARKAEAA